MGLGPSSELLWGPDRVAKLGVHGVPKSAVNLMIKTCTKGPLITAMLGNFHIGDSSDPFSQVGILKPTL